MQLVQLQEQYSTVEALNAQVIAISADNLEGAGWAIEQQGLEYPVLYDTDSTIIKTYGLYNANDQGRSRTATFIIDRNGYVRWQYLGRSTSDRPPNSLVFEQVGLINSSEN